MSNPFATISIPPTQSTNNNNRVPALPRNIHSINNKTNSSMDELLNRDILSNSFTRVSPDMLHDDANIESSCVPHYIPSPPKRNQQIKVQFHDVEDFQNMNIPLSHNQHFQLDIESQHNYQVNTITQNNFGFIPVHQAQKSISTPQFYSSNLQENNNNNIHKSQDLSFRSNDRPFVVQDNILQSSSHMISSEIISNHLQLKPIQFEIYRYLRNTQIKREVAFFIIIFEGCMSLDEALSKLTTNQNGLYDHIFVYKSQNGINNQTCEICGSAQSQHIQSNNTERNDSARLTYDRICELSTTGKLIPKELIYQQVQFVECQICLTQVAENNLLKIKQETHPICVDCFRQYLEQEITLAHVDKLKCPHCSKVLDEQIILDHITSTVLKKYKYFLSKLLVNKDRLKRFCPSPNCDNIINLSTVSQEIATCTQCKNDICTLCNRHSHPGISCNKLMDKEIQELSDSRDIQRCAQCYSLVQKAEGCNHMTCSICSYQWCWLCGNTYTRFHVMPINPFGCPMLQGGQFTVHNMQMWKIYIIRFLALLVLIIIFPFGLILSGPLFALAGYMHIMSRKFPNIGRESIWTKTWIIILGVIVFILGLILVPIFLILSVPFGIFLIYEHIQEKRRNQIIVNQRLEQIRGRNNFHNG